MFYQEKMKTRIFNVLTSVAPRTTVNVTTGAILLQFKSK